jgi:outer membrane protein OmpA-like peptidoglycan-associated protein
MVSPYLFVGIGGNYKTIVSAQTAIPDAEKLGYQFNIGGGVEVKLIPELNLVTEFGYYTTTNSTLDGTVVPGELNGRDSYMAISAGLNYIFGKGGSSELCETCGEKSTAAENEKTEAINAKNSAGKAAAEGDIIQISDDRLVLTGIDFAYAKSHLLPGSYAALDKAVKLLNSRPDLKVEIEGYTDYAGNGDYNQKLSLARAQTIKNYLVYKGIAAGRLTTAGYGVNNPVEDNKTAEGRAMNKRIVLRILKNN